jgi:hypothetical protein
MPKRLRSPTIKMMAAIMQWQYGQAAKMQVVVSIVVLPETTTKVLGICLSKNRKEVTVSDCRRNVVQPSATLNGQFKINFLGCMQSPSAHVREECLPFLWPLCLCPLPLAVELGEAVTTVFVGVAGSAGYVAAGGAAVTGLAPAPLHEAPDSLDGKTF